MTYNLADFLNWLEANPAKKLGFADWKDFLEKKEKLDQEYAGYFVSWAMNNNAFWTGSSSQAAINAHQRALIVLEWKQFVDQEQQRERERERAKLDLVKLKLTHWTQLINQLNPPK